MALVLVVLLIFTFAQYKVLDGIFLMVLGSKDLELMYLEF